MNDLIRVLPLVALLVTLIVVSPVAHAQKRVATGSVPPAAFADPNRKQKLATAFPEIEKLFNSFAERMPGAVMGIARMLATRQAAQYYLKSTGQLPKALVRD